MREIQFLEFMGGYNVPQAFSNHLIFLCFIRISMVALDQFMLCHQSATVDIAILISSLHTGYYTRLHYCTMACKSNYVIVSN